MILLKDFRVSFKKINNIFKVKKEVSKKCTIKKQDKIQAIYNI